MGEETDEVRGVCRNLEKRKARTGKTYYTLDVDGTTYSTFQVPEGLVDGDKIEFGYVKKGKYNNVSGEIRIISKGDQQRLKEEKSDEGEKKITYKKATTITDIDTLASEAATILSKCKDACKDVLEEEDNEVINSLFIYVTRELRTMRSK